MNKIEKAIERLKSCSIIPFDDDAEEVCGLAIKALEKQLTDRWIPVSDGKYIIEVKEGEVVSCQNFKI